MYLCFALGPLSGAILSNQLTWLTMVVRIDRSGARYSKRDGRVGSSRPMLRQKETGL